MAALCHELAWTPSSIRHPCWQRGRMQMGGANHIARSHSLSGMASMASLFSHNYSDYSALPCVAPPFLLVCSQSSLWSLLTSCCCVSYLTSNTLYSIDQTVLTPSILGHCCPVVVVLFSSLAVAYDSTEYTHTTQTKGSRQPSHLHLTRTEINLSPPCLSCSPHSNWTLVLYLLTVLNLPPIIFRVGA